MNGNQRQNTRNEDAADGADDRARRFPIPAADDELRGERDDAADEERPKEDVRRRKEDEGDQPLCDEEHRKEQDEECLESRQPAKEHEENAKADEQPYDSGQAVIVRNGIALTLGAQEHILARLRVDVKGGIVRSRVQERDLCICSRPRRESCRHVVLDAAGGKGRKCAVRLCRGDDFRLVGRGIGILSARQVEDAVEQHGEREADGEKACKSTRVNFHSRQPFV